jgi:hypothetical protein
MGSAVHRIDHAAQVFVRARWNGYALGRRGWIAADTGVEASMLTPAIRPDISGRPVSEQ